MDSLLLYLLKLQYRKNKYIKDDLSLYNIYTITNFISAASLEGGKGMELNGMDFKGISYIPVFRGVSGKERFS